MTSPAIRSSPGGRVAHKSPLGSGVMPTESEVIQYLVAKHHPEAVILVGSRADGQERPGSDWDLYLLLEPDSSGVRGPLPVPDLFDGDLLDAALVRLPIDARDVGPIFGPNLRQDSPRGPNTSGPVSPRRD